VPPQSWGCADDGVVSCQILHRDRVESGSEDSQACHDVDAGEGLARLRICSCIAGFKFADSDCAIPANAQKLAARSNK
jgi:hypothetical protein